MTIHERCFSATVRSAVRGHHVATCIPTVMPPAVSCGPLHRAPGIPSTQVTIRTAGGILVEEQRANRGGIPRLPESKGTVLGKQGQALRYWMYGARGPAMVLCNGLFSSVDAWGDFVDHFSRTHRLLLWEYKGHGISTGTPREEDVTVRSFAEDAGQLVEGVGIQKAIFVGQGFGVQVALEFYRNAPEKVTSIIGLCGAEEGRLSGMGPINREKVFPRYLEKVVLPFGVPFWKVFRALWTASLPFRQKEGDGSHPSGSFANGKGKAWLEQISRTDPRIGLRILASTLFYHPGALLPQICIPVLILGGTEDRVVPAERYMEMARRIPGSRLVLLKGCTHMAMAEEPENVNRFVEEFLHDQNLF